MSCLVEPQDVVLIAVNGYFGGRLSEMVKFFFFFFFFFIFFFFFFFFFFLFFIFFYFFIIFFVFFYFFTRTAIQTFLRTRVDCIDSPFVNVEWDSSQTCDCINNEQAIVLMADISNPFQLISTC